VALDRVGGTTSCRETKCDKAERTLRLGPLVYGYKGSMGFIYNTPMKTRRLSMAVVSDDEHESFCTRPRPSVHVVSDDDHESISCDSVASTLSSWTPPTPLVLHKPTLRRRVVGHVSILESLFQTLSLSPDENDGPTPPRSISTSTTSFSGTANDSDPSSSGSSTSSPGWSGSQTTEQTSDDESSVETPRFPMIREQDDDDLSIRTGDSSIQTYNDLLRFQL